MTEFENVVTLRPSARLAAELAKVHPDELPEVWDHAWDSLMRANSEFGRARCHRPKLVCEGAGPPTWWRRGLNSFRRGAASKPYIVIDPAEAAAPAERLWRAWHDLHAAWEEFERIDRAAVVLFGRGS